MQKLTIIILAFTTFCFFGQEYKCNVSRDSLAFVNMPHYNNNAILNDVKTIIDNAKTSQKGNVSFASNNFLFNIPIKIWILHDDDGSNEAFSEVLVNNDIELVNQDFEENDTSIRFYKKCSIEHIYNTKLNTINSNSEFSSLVSSYRDDKALNWIYIDDVDYNDSDDNWGGKATWPEANVNFTFVTQTSTSQVLTHEIGHCFGLLHTHETARSSGDNGDAGDCYQEAVSRTRRNSFWNACFSTHNSLKCEINGDAFCDTDASPGSLIGDFI